VSLVVGCLCTMFISMIKVKCCVRQIWSLVCNAVFVDYYFRIRKL